MKNLILLIISAFAVLAFTLSPSEFRTDYRHETEREKLFNLIDSLNYKFIPEDYRELNFNFWMNCDTFYTYQFGMYLFLNDFTQTKNSTQTVSCADCHQTSLSGFSGIDKSIGFGGIFDGRFRRINNKNDVEVTDVASPTILNVFNADSFVTWNGRIGGNDTLLFNVWREWKDFKLTPLQLQILFADAGHQMSLGDIQNDPIAKQYCKLAFGDDYISLDRIVMSIVAFELVFRSIYTPLYFESKGYYNMTLSELRGANIVFSKCYTGCHSGSSLGNEHLINGIKVPQLFNLVDGGKHYGSKDTLTLNEAIVHAVDLTKKEKRDVKKFLINNKDESVKNLKFR